MEPMWTEYHLNSVKVEMHAPRWLILVDGKWFGLRDYQQKAIEDFMDSGAILRYRELAEKGFVNPACIGKQYESAGYNFRLEFRELPRLLTGGNSAIPTFEERYEWNYYPVYLIREDGSESKLLAHPSYLGRKEVEADTRFNSLGVIDSSVVYTDPLEF